MSDKMKFATDDMLEATRQALLTEQRRYENICFLSDKRDAEKRVEIATLHAQIADLELQHVGDKAIIEALNERVGELEGYIQDTNDACCELEDKNQILRNDLAVELRLRQHFQSEVVTLEATLTRRDAAFAALVECIRATDQFSESLNSCLSCRANLAINQTLCNFHGGRQHWVTEQRREALKLVAELEEQ